MMIELILAGMALAASGAGVQAASHRQVTPQCAGSVELPQELKYEARPLAGGTATSHFYWIQVNGVTFAVFCVIDASLGSGDPDVWFSTYRDGLTNHDPNALLAERTVSVDSTQGREMHAVGPDGTHRLVRLSVTPGRAVGLMVIGSKEAVSTREAESFFTSFRFEWVP